MARVTPVLNAISYFLSIFVTLFVFVVAIGYIILAISVNSGRTSDLALIEAAIQTSTAELANHPTPENVPFIRAAISDLNAKRVGQKKEIDFGKDKFWSKTFRDCALSFNVDCFYRNSSAMNIIYLAMASGALGVCLFFLILIRADAISAKFAFWNSSTFISLVCLIPTGIAVALLALFILKGAKGAILTPVAEVVQVENPFGVAFACTVAAFFSDRILAGLSRLLEHFGLARTTLI